MLTVVMLDGGVGSWSPLKRVRFMVSEPMVMSSWGCRRWNMCQLSHELAAPPWGAAWWGGLVRVTVVGGNVV